MSADARVETTWKIIGCDNFNRESEAEWLVADNVRSEEIGNVLVDALRAKYSGDNSPTWFKLEKADYKLWRGMEEFI